MNFSSKWSELSSADKQKAKDQYGNKQGWQDAKSRAQGYANEQERRGNSGERHTAKHQAGNGSAAQNDQALNNEHSPKANDVGAQSKPAAAQSRYGANTNWDKQAKGGVSDEVRNDPRLQEMVKDPHDGKMKNKYAIRYSGGNIIKNPAVHNLAAVQSTQQKQAKRDAERGGSAVQYDAKQARQDSAYAYKQSRLDMQKEKDDVGKRGVYEYQSAKDLQTSKGEMHYDCLLYTSPSPRDRQKSRMPSSA